MQNDPSTPGKPLRLWPGITAAVLLIVARFVIPAVAPEAEFMGVDAAMLSIFGGIVLALVVLLWWLLFSRVPWTERLGAIPILAVAIIATRPLMHLSIQNGFMGWMFYIYAVPVSLGLALVGWALVSRRLYGWSRWAAMVVAIFIGCGAWTLARTNGILGGMADLEWRWTPTAEDRLLALAAAEPPVPSVAPAEAPRESPAAPRDEPVATPATKTEPTAPADSRVERPAMAVPAVPGERGAPVEARAPGFTRVEWPGFRGPGRDDVVRGVAIDTDWAASPPVQLWRRPIGPGWSSLAVADGRLYTQEQRGGDEIVACYDAATGKPVWMHRDPVRFWESNGGTGPRGTPTLDKGRVYTLGATGALNALDARTGTLAWTRNVLTDSGVKVPEWGFTSSPLVVDSVVVVAASGALAAYDSREWNAALVAQVRRRQLQFTAPGHDRRRPPGPVAEWSGGQQCCRSRWHAALGERVAGRAHRAAGADCPGRVPDYDRRCHGRAGHAASLCHASGRRVGR